MQLKGQLVPEWMLELVWIKLMDASAVLICLQYLDCGINLGYEFLEESLSKYFTAW